LKMWTLFRLLCQGGHMSLWINRTKCNL
jgi:hypothetical protein